MVARRQWSSFPSAMWETVIKFGDTPGGVLYLDNLSKSDAFNMRNEFHRFRRAVLYAVEIEHEDNPTLRKLFATIRDMSLQLQAATDPSFYRLVYTQHVASRHLGNWKAPEPLVDVES